MKYSLSKDGTSATIQMSGRLTFEDHKSFRSLIGELSAGGINHVVVDMNQLEFIDSVGLGLLLIMRDDLVNRQGRFSLKNPTGEVKRIFSISHASSIFTIE